MSVLIYQCKLDSSSVMNVLKTQLTHCKQNKLQVLKKNQGSHNIMVRNQQMEERVIVHASPGGVSFLVHTDGQTYYLKKTGRGITFWRCVKCREEAGRQTTSSKAKGLVLKTSNKDCVLLKTMGEHNHAC